MLGSKMKKDKSDIWDRITLSSLINAIVALNDQIDELEKETWRLNKNGQNDNSLWNKLIESLGLDVNESTRRSLYNIWHKNRHNIRDSVAMRISANRGCHDSHADDEHVSNEASQVSMKKQPLLKTMTSSPIHLRSKQNVDEDKDSKVNKRQTPVISEHSLIFTASEWKEVFSRTDQKMKPDWTKMFADKISSSGFTCTLRFKTPVFKRGERKKNCRFFCCYAKCMNSRCPRTFHIILPREPDVGTSLLFLIRTYGEEKHDASIETTARPLKGNERLLVGKQVNDIGPTTFFQQRVKDADQRLLAAGNFSGCETIETLKKAAADYRKKMAVDENLFMACRIYRRVYRKWDKEAKNVPGSLDIMSSEWPFCLHLYTEKQINRYIRYCSRTKYPLVHIDATGGVLKQMTEQKRSYLYAVIFKDGDDTVETIPLAHAILTDHTTMGIQTFLGNLAQNITKVKGKLVHPAFFITDFSPAIMNATLLAFNSESMKSHLHRCWNVIHKKYETAQLKSSCFLHLCCSHVMSAVAKNLVDANIEKDVRESVLYLFALIICETEIEEMYDLLGSLVSIFGDPTNGNAEKDLESLLAQQLDIDEESQLALIHNEQIFLKASELNEELNEVDEYFRSNVAIIHESPFNKEAIRRYPTIEKILNSKSSFPSSQNSLFSRKLMRLIYKWWAYLPLWTSLLVEFKERYGNGGGFKLITSHSPIRFSNALIESYFKTLKRVTLKGKRYERPDVIIESLLDTIEQQMKASKYGVTHSSKGRKRKKHDLDEEKWNKKATTGKKRSKYFNLIDKIKAKRLKTVSLKPCAKNSVEKSKELDGSSTPLSERSPSSSQQSADRISLNRHVSDDEIDSRSSSSSSSSSSSDKNSSSRSSVDKSDWPSNVSSNRSSNVDLPTTFSPSSSEDSIAVPVKNKVTTVKRSAEVLECSPGTSHPAVVIDGYSIRWPKFQISNAIFENQTFTIANTCNVDCGLFVFYYLYRTDSSITKAIDEAPPGSPYASLKRTFQYADTDGWDSARIFWLLTNQVLAPTDQKIKNLFGSLDENVFRFIKSTQRYSRVAVCERTNCSTRRRVLISTELCVTASDDFLPEFDVENVARCGTVIKQHGGPAPDDQTEGSSQKNVSVLDVETNQIEYVNNFVCGAQTVTSAARFEQDSPPIVVVDILSPKSRSKNNRQNLLNARLNEIKAVLRIGSVKYALRAVINHRSDHFTATLIGKRNDLYVYDDTSGVERVTRSMDMVETGIFTMIDES